MSDLTGCRFDCRTAKQNWISGFQEAVRDLMPGYIHSDEYLTEKYNEWKRRQT